MTSAVQLEKKLLMGEAICNNAALSDELALVGGFLTFDPFWP
jgi:hypothetical protein